MILEQQAWDRTDVIDEEGNVGRNNVW
jgi:hypothetical protein